MLMEKFRQIPDFKKITEEEYNALVARLQQRAALLEEEKIENEKEIAALKARAAYLAK